MPELFDAPIQSLIQAIKSDPALLKCNLKEIMEKFPALHEAYSLNDETERQNFSKYWFSLKTSLLRSMSRQPTPIAPTPYSGADQVVFPGQAFPRQVFQQGQFTPTANHFHAPQQVVHTTVINNNYNDKVIYSSNKENDSHNTSTPVDTTKLKDEIVSGVVEKLDPKFSKLNKDVVNTIRKDRAPPLSARRATRYSPAYETTIDDETLNTPGYETPSVRKHLFSSEDDGTRGKHYFRRLLEHLDVNGCGDVQRQRIQDVNAEKDFQFPIAAFAISVDNLVETTNQVFVVEPSLDMGQGAFVYVTENDSHPSFDDCEGTGSMSFWHSAGTTALGFNVTHSVTIEDEEDHFLSIVVATRRRSDALNQLSSLLTWASNKPSADVVIESSVSENSASLPLHEEALKHLATNRSGSRLSFQRASLTAEQLGALLVFPAVLEYKFSNCSFEDDGQTLFVHYPEGSSPHLKLCFDGWCPKIGNLLLAVSKGRIDSLQIMNFIVPKRDMESFRTLCLAATEQGWEIVFEYVKCDEAKLGFKTTQEFFAQKKFSSLERFLTPKMKSLEDTVTTAAIFEVDNGKFVNTLEKKPATGNNMPTFTKKGTAMDESISDNSVRGGNVMSESFEKDPPSNVPAAEETMPNCSPRKKKPATRPLRRSARLQNQ